MPSRLNMKLLGVQQQQPPREKNRIDMAFHDVVQMGVAEEVDVGVSFVCHLLNQINSGGIWRGDNPLDYSLPLLMLQLSLISIITRSIYILLKPFGQPMIVSQILGGVILGPSILGQNVAFATKVFPSKGRAMIDTLSVFGFMLFIFLIGVKMDATMILRSGRKALAIGILGFSVPLVLARFVAFILVRSLSLDHEISNALPLIVAVQSMSTFPVIACFLSELKILNSEIGRLASNSSIICDACQWTLVTLKFAVKVASARSLKSSIGSCFSAALFMILIVFGIRPAALWAIRHTPEGKPVKEIYIFVLFVALMCCAFMGEVIGLSALFASFIFGLVIPDGPPLGAALVERLDCFVSVLLMPIFFTICGLRTNIFAIQNLKNVGVIQFVIFVSFIGKIIGTILPPLFCRMPFRDALSLALIMNSKGIVELAVLYHWKNQKIMNEECFAIMIVSVVVVTGVISPLVKALYDPSRRFLAYKRRTILHSRADEELRILACIHSQDNVQAAVDLLDASNPTKDSPMSLIVLHLLKLEGRASSLLIAHRPREKLSLNPSQSERIFNAFIKFEQQHHNLVTLHCYKGISPYATMYNDVCSLALEKRTSLIIIPFHKQWVSGGRLEAPYAFRHLNKKVLDKAPCSVGILINRTNRKKPQSALAEPPSLYQVAVLFFGGADDREALSYARRMLEHPNVRLTLLRFCASTEIVGGTARSRMLDAEILDEFKRNLRVSERVSYKEQAVKDGMDVLSVTREMENACDLVIVGRRRGESQFMAQHMKQNERGELGIVGEILAASDYEGRASILVMQQQTRVWGLHDPEESTHLRRVNL